MAASRRTLLKTALAGVAGAAVGGSAYFASRAARRRRKDYNVILIVADSLRSDKIGKLVNGMEVTPSLNSFAGESVSFRNAFAAASWTKCSVASMLSGQFPHYHGVVSPHLTLPDIPTLPGYLGDKGYLTIGLTSNPVIKPETNQDEAGKPYAVKAGFGYPFLQKSRETGEKRGLYLFCAPEESARLEQGNYSEGYADTEVLFSQFLKVLDTNLYVSAHPFFAYMHDMRTHRPWITREPIEGVTGRFHEEKEDIEAVHKKDLDALVRCVFPTQRDIPPQEIQRRLMAINDEAAFLFDAHFAGLVGELKTRGLYEKTIIVFTADHGDEFYEHGKIGHAQNLYNPSLLVPLAIRHPDVSARSVDARVTNASIFPTVRELLDDAPAEDATVFSLKPYMTGEVPAARESFDVLASLSNMDKYISPDGIAVIRSPSACEVYDLVHDPVEKNDIVERHDAASGRCDRAIGASKELAKRHGVKYVVTNLPAMKADGMNPDGTFNMPDGTKANLSDEEIRQFRALGYLQ